MKLSVRPPLIPNENEQDNQEEGFFTSFGKLIGGAKSSISEISGSVFSGFRKKPKNNQNQSYYQYHNNQQQQQRRTNTWPMQESFEIPDEDEPPPRTPTPKKTYAFMSNDPGKIHQLRQGRAYFNGWDGGEQQQQQQQQQQQHVYQQHLQQHRQHSLGPQTYYEQSCENTNEIVFGAVQELDSKLRTVEIKAVNYGEPLYDQYGLRSRMQYSGYNNGY